MPTAYAQEFIDLSEGLRRDLVRMSLAKSIAEARFDTVVSVHLFEVLICDFQPTLFSYLVSLQQAPSAQPPPSMRPPRAPRGGHDGAGLSRKRSSGNR